MKRVEQIVEELEALEPLRKLIKEQSMIYQFELKLEVAEALGLKFEEVDIRYEEWAKIRDAYLRRKEEEYDSKRPAEPAAILADN